ncbi:hypothetical protein [Streptomyces cyaneogriseus]|nr:hypothetical protein [Streptomyces cyaneogriseus]
MAEGRPAWARRIARERVARGWSVRDAARAMRVCAPAETAAEESLVRQWECWEAGQMPDGVCRPVLAAVLGTVTYALFPVPSRWDGDQGFLAGSGGESPEVVSRLDGSRVDGAALDALRVTVGRLASAYAFVPGERLLVEARRWLRRVVGLRTKSLTPSQRREVLALSGRLALLVGCLEYDTGDRRAAESARLAALSFATEAGHAEVAGWAHEMRAWFALTAGDCRGALAAARAGLAVAPHHGVAVQLAAQEAKAWARLGDRREAEAALDKGRRLLEGMPYPENPADHFVVDPAKFDFYAMDCHRVAGEDRLARTLAEEVLRAGTAVDGTARSPMRDAEARITLGVTAAREGDLEQALAMGERALEAERRSVPSLLMLSRELAVELRRRYSAEPAVRKHLARLHALERP